MQKNELFKKVVLFFYQPIEHNDRNCNLLNVSMDLKIRNEFLQRLGIKRLTLDSVFGFNIISRLMLGNYNLFQWKN